MRTRIRLGQSSTVTLPKALAEAAGLEREVDVSVSDGFVTIRRPGNPRAGWNAAFRAMHENGDDQLIGGDVPNLSSWDEEEWEW